MKTFGDNNLLSESNASCANANGSFDLTDLRLALLQRSHGLIIIDEMQAYIPQPETLDNHEPPFESPLEPKCNYENT